jgi:hypothetical protein
MKFIGKEQKIVREYVDREGRKTEIGYSWARQTSLISTIYFFFIPVWRQKMIDSYTTKY